LNDPGESVEYLLSDEAIAAGSLTVEEIGEGGSVPNLLVSYDGDCRVLFLEGEELKGAKQNRVLNTSVLVAAQSKTTTRRPGTGRACGRRGVDVDVAEVGLEAMSRQMAEGNERLAVSPPVLEHVALDLGIPAGIVVLVAEATMDLCGSMPLLGRGVLVVGEDAITTPMAS
jgi:hypothetical protein